MRRAYTAYSAGGPAMVGPAFGRARTSYGRPQPRSRRHTGGWIVTRVLIVVGPAVLLLVIARPSLAAQWLFLALAAVIVAGLLSGDTDGALALVIATLPAAMLLRSLLLYNSVLVILAVTTGAALLESAGRLQMLRRAGVLTLIYIGVVYWLASFALTGEYFRNLRILELLLGAACMVLLTRAPRTLAAGLLGMATALLVLGLGFLSFGGRLGLIDVAGVHVGNPIAFGAPLALLVLLLTADGGRCVLPGGRPAIRWLLAAALSLLLVLSTSRGAWMTAGAGLLVILILGANQRRFLLRLVLGVTIGAGMLLKMPVGETLHSSLDRTFSTERDLANRTSGRSDQWLLFPRVLSEMPILGHGPGSGGRVYAAYSLRDPRVRLHPGSPVEWHSLYQHIVVETGLAGGALLLVLLGVLTRRGLVYWRRSRELAPLLGIIGFGTITLSVSGMDGISGLYLGMALAPAAYDSAGRL